MNNVGTTSRTRTTTDYTIIELSRTGVFSAGRNEILKIHDIDTFTDDAIGIHYRAKYRDPLGRSLVSKSTTELSSRRTDANTSPVYATRVLLQDRPSCHKLRRTAHHKELVRRYPAKLGRDCAQVKINGILHFTNLIDKRLTADQNIVDGA